MMPSYQYDDIKDKFAKYVTSNAKLGKKAIMYFYRKEVVKHKFYFPSLKTFYNWYAEMVK